MNKIFFPCADADYSTPFAYKEAMRSPIPVLHVLQPAGKTCFCICDYHRGFTSTFFIVFAYLEGFNYPSLLIRHTTPHCGHAIQISGAAALAQMFRQVFSIITHDEETNKNRVYTLCGKLVSCTAFLFKGSTAPCRF